LAHHIFAIQTTLTNILKREALLVRAMQVIEGEQYYWSMGNMVSRKKFHGILLL